jgi:hypothetical protein
MSTDDPTDISDLAPGPWRVGGAWDDEVHLADGRCIVFAWGERLARALALYPEMRAVCAAADEYLEALGELEPALAGGPGMGELHTLLACADEGRNVLQEAIRALRARKESVR